MTFAVFRRGTAPVLAVPLDRSLRVATSAVGLLPSYTLKRKAFKAYALTAAAALWALHRMGLHSGGALPPAERDLLAEILALSGDGATAVPIWSLVPGRQRWYVRVLDRDGEEMAFAKVSRDDQGRSRLEVEAEALSRYGDARTFAVPRLIGCRRSGDSLILMTSALPRDRRLLHAERTDFPEAIQRELQSGLRPCQVGALRAEDWHARGLAAFEAGSPFRRFVEGLDPSHEVAVGPAHGDFGSENFFASGQGRTFLIDWEHFSDRAPALTDRVGFWIGRNHRAIQAGSTGVAPAFARDFAGQSEADLSLALLYLAGFGVTDAARLANRWKR